MIVFIQDRKEMNSLLGKYLNGQLGDGVHVVAYDSDENKTILFDFIYEDIKTAVPFHDIELLMGQGLGGYWALWMGSIARVPTYVINPELNPYGDEQAITFDPMPNYIPLNILLSNDGHTIDNTPIFDVFGARADFTQIWPDPLLIDPEDILHDVENVLIVNKEI